ncbi:MAG: hypothetical protein LC769_06570 [Chloroflexi bacterium]|nr:hypothetical protein [Chloroflexota bacterium]
MPTIGTDCQVILDGTGYWLEPANYQVERARIRRADLTGLAANPVAPGAGAGEKYIDRGPGKRVWKFIVVCFNNMTTYAGTAIASTGQQFHDALQASYNKVNTTLTYTDPGGVVWTVRFDDLVEDIADVRSQTDTSIQYYMHVTLVEA